jgi:uncharacterized protein with GYD domain
MPKYLYQATYAGEGTEGLLKDGGSKRRGVIEEMAKAASGKLATLYHVSGEPKVFVIVEAPIHASAAAISLAVDTGGAVQLKTTVLFIPKETDQATKKSGSYRPPGK